MINSRLSLMSNEMIGKEEGLYAWRSKPEYIRYWSGFEWVGEVDSDTTAEVVALVDSIWDDSESASEVDTFDLDSLTDREIAIETLSELMTIRRQVANDLSRTNLTLTLIGVSLGGLAFLSLLSLLF